jgi:hypothetical protein
MCDSNRPDILRVPQESLSKEIIFNLTLNKFSRKEGREEGEKEEKAPQTAGTIGYTNVSREMKNN